MRDAFLAAASKFLDREGEPATFNPASGDPIPCKVFIDFDVLLQPASMDAQAWAKGTQIEAGLSSGDDIGIGRMPEYGETFTVWPGDPLEQTYSVKEILQNDGITVKVVVV